MTHGNPAFRGPIGAQMPNAGAGRACLPSHCAARKLGAASYSHALCDSGGMHLLAATPFASDAADYLLRPRQCDVATFDALDRDKNQMLTIEEGRSNIDLDQGSTILISNRTGVITRAYKVYRAPVWNRVCAEMMPVLPDAISRHFKRQLSRDGDLTTYPPVNRRPRVFSE